MEVVVFRDRGLTAEKSWLGFALADERLCAMVRDGHQAASADRGVTFAVPQQWPTAHGNGDVSVTRYDRKRGIELAGLDGDSGPEWLVISNGASVCKAHYEWLERHIKDTAADVVCVTFEPGLSGYHEKIRTTKDNAIVGWRRYYADGIELCETPKDWPDRIFIRMGALRKIWPGKALTGDFAKFLSACSANSLSLASIKAAGRVLDLDSEEGLLGLVRHACSWASHGNGNGPEITGAGARIVGTVIFGRGVRVGEKAVIVGPAVLGDGVRIGERAIVKGAVIGSQMSVPADAVVRDRVVRDSRVLAEEACAEAMPGKNTVGSFSENGAFERDYFRTWRPWSYPRYIKRLFDVVAASAILLLFLPFFPVIALAIKLSSPGPVFYRARRQGLGGKEFDCLKFRTMVPTAEGLQEKLRAVNQVDGPQFKLENDPRVNAVGRFLRDTNLDEIPQFINVLRGQMSMIGPRPSPEHENAGCPHWRYARLSVRPGITGLWQLCRTREEGRDFQEWVHYDTTYVRKLSFGMDAWIFWKTAQKLINDFVDQF
jgi:lipopolysaccharide/colanic/teichoic acid biosynthesis glycosyltransferase/carbonic anhydrase/acetyltransferase-like protein (isoleucine patch superfamily)